MKLDNEFARVFCSLADIGIRRIKKKIVIASKLLYWIFKYILFSEFTCNYDILKNCDWGNKYKLLFNTLSKAFY